MESVKIVSTANTKTFYKVAGALAILIVAAGLTDAITSMGAAAHDNRAIPITEWFTLFQTSRFEAFSRLGLINMITLSLSIPIYTAFNLAFRKERPGMAAFATILFFIGVSVYLSSNTVFALFAVSQKYAAASPTQKPLLEAAGRALVEQGADLTPGTFLGLCFTQIAGLLITFSMIRGKVFGKWIGWMGITGFSIMTVFFILTAFFPDLYNTAMMVAAPGGLVMIVYEIMVARKFFQLGAKKERVQ